MGGLTKNNMNKNIGIVIGIIVLVVAGGVYISMNGKIFSWNNVRKNLKTGYFEKER